MAKTEAAVINIHGHTNGKRFVVTNSQESWLEDCN